MAYIIAEAGVNHNGRLDLAMKLCDAAKIAGVDAVKFQTWKTEKIVTRNTRMAEYQQTNTGQDETSSQYDMLKALELSYNDFQTLRNYCQEIGIDFLSTPDEEESLDFLVRLGIKTLKISSGEITNIPYLRKIASYNLPVILSTGMATLAEVAAAYDTLLQAGAPSVSLLHCTTNYPCPYNEVNLRAMHTLRQAFHCQVGYSDHTMGIEVPIAAVAMGATIIEKHFTLDKGMAGPDHQASLEPHELTAMVQAIRHIETALGDGIKRPNDSEKAISRVVLKSIVAAVPISKGETLIPEKLTVKRVGQGISASYWDIVIGTTANRDYSIDDPIEIS